MIFLNIYFIKLFYNVRFDKIEIIFSTNIMKQDKKKFMLDESDDTDSEEVLSRIGRVPF